MKIKTLGFYLKKIYIYIFKFLQVFTLFGIFIKSMISLTFETSSRYRWLTVQQIAERKTVRSFQRGLEKGI